MENAKASTTPAALTPAGDDPNERPYPGYARELAAIEAKRRAAERAASATLPGPLRESFAGDPQVVHGFTLQPVRMSLHVMLEKIHSPLLEVVRILREEMGREDGADVSTPALQAAVNMAREKKAAERINAEIAPDPEALVETVFCFVTPMDELRHLWACGRPTFRETAMRAVADKLTGKQFAEMQQAVSAHYSASFATAIRYAPPKQEGSNDTFFSAPPAGTMTVSAGGSPSSAC